MDDFEMTHNASALDDQDNISVSNPGSESEFVCYSNKSIEFENQSVDLSRSISSCSQCHGSERAAGKGLINT